MAGYTIVGDTYVAPSGSTPGYIEVTVLDETQTAADLAAAQYLDISFAFAAQSVSGNDFLSIGIIAFGCVCISGALHLFARLSLEGLRDD